MFITTNNLFSHDLHGLFEWFSIFISKKQRKKIEKKKTKTQTKIMKKFAEIICRQSTN